MHRPQRRLLLPIITSACCSLLSNNAVSVQLFGLSWCSLTAESARLFTAFPEHTQCVFTAFRSLGRAGQRAGRFARGGGPAVRERDRPQKCGRALAQVLVMIFAICCGACQRCLSCCRQLPRLPAAWRRCSTFPSNHLVILSAHSSNASPHHAHRIYRKKLTLVAEPALAKPLPAVDIWAAEDCTAKHDRSVSSFCTPGFRTLAWYSDLIEAGPAKASHESGMVIGGTSDWSALRPLLRSNDLHLFLLSSLLSNGTSGWPAWPLLHSG